MDDVAIKPTFTETAKIALTRGLGAAVVATLCLVTAEHIPFFHQPYWAPIAALVVLQADRNAARKAGFDRFVGTALGSLVGWGAAVFWHGNIFLYALAILIAVAICFLLRVDDASRLCAVAVTVITLIPRTEPPHLIAFYRFIEVSYGVAFALVYLAVFDRVTLTLRGAQPTAEKPDVE